MHNLFKTFFRERGNLYSIASTSATSIIASSLLLLAFANLLDPTSLGVYQYLVAIVSIITSVSLTGITSAIIRAAGKKDFGFFPIAFTYTLYSFAIPIGITIAVSGYYFIKGNVIFAVGIFISTFLALLIQYLMRYNAIYVGIERFQESNHLLKALVISPLLILLVALLFTKNPAILAILYFLGSALGLTLMVLILKMPNVLSGLVEKSVSIDNNRIKEYLSFALHQSIITLIKTFTTHFDKIIVFQLLGAQATAMYFIAVSIPDRLRSLIKQFEPYLFSKFAKYSAHATQTTFTFKFIFGLLSILPIYIIYVLSVPFFIQFFLPQYTDIINLTIIYGLTLFSGTLVISDAVMRAHAKNSSFYVLTVGYFVGKLIIFVPLTWYFGLTGAITATTIAILTYTLASYMITKRI